MTAKNKLLTLHLQAETQRWECVINDIKNLLNNDKLIVNLTKKLLTMSAYARWNAFGGSSEFLPGFYSCGFDLPYSSIDILEFVNHFIKYELLDDGLPGVIYYRWDNPRLTYERCKKKDKGATPYFHSNVEVLRKEDPKAEFLTPKQALEILELHEASYEEFCTRVMEDYPKGGDVETDEEKQQRELFQALVQELTNDQ